MAARLDPSCSWCAIMFWGIVSAIQFPQINSNEIQGGVMKACRIFKRTKGKQYELCLWMLSFGRHHSHFSRWNGKFRAAENRLFAHHLVIRSRDNMIATPHDLAPRELVVKRAGSLQKSPVFPPL